MPTETVITGVAINGSEMCYLSADDETLFTYVDPNGNLMCGTPDHVAARVVPGMEIVRVTLLLAPTPGELDVIVPLLGTTESPADTFDPVDAGPPAFPLLLKRNSDKVHAHSGSRINKAVFRSQAGLHPLTLELEIFSLTWSEGSTFNPAAVTPDFSYTHTDGALTIDDYGADRNPSAFAWALDNHLAPRFNNSVTADTLGFFQRTLHIGCNLPYDHVHDDILTTFTTAATRHEGVALSMSYDRGGKQLQFSHDNVKWEARPPKILNKAEDVRLNCFFKAYRDKTANDRLFRIIQDATGA